jgi:hypothetical protein
MDWKSVYFASKHSETMTEWIGLEQELPYNGEGGNRKKRKAKVVIFLMLHTWKNLKNENIVPGTAVIISHS